MSKHHSVWGCLTEWLLAEMNLALLFLSLNICSDNKRTDWATESQSWWWPASAHVNVTWGWFKLFSFNQTNCFTVWICCCKHAWCECVIYPSLFFYVCLLWPVPTDLWMFFSYFFPILLIILWPLRFVLRPFVGVPTQVGYHSSIVQLWACVTHHPLPLSALPFSAIKHQFSPKVLLHHTHSPTSPLGTRRFDIQTQCKHFSLMT